MAFDNADAFRSLLQNQGAQGSHGGGIVGCLLGTNAVNTNGLFTDSPGIMAANINGLGSIFNGKQQAQGPLAKALQQAWQDLSQMNKDHFAQVAQGNGNLVGPLSTPANSNTVGGIDTLSA